MTSKESFLFITTLAVVMLFGCSHEDFSVAKPQFDEDGTQSEWRLVSSKSGHFKVQMPGTPKPDTNIFSTPAGQIFQHGLIVETNTIAFGVLYLDLPKQYEKFDRSMALNSIRAGLIGEGGNLIDERHLTLDSREVTEFVIEKLNGKARATVWTYFYGERNYTLIVVMPNSIFISPKYPKDSIVASNMITRFFNSMEIQK